MMDFRRQIAHAEATQGSMLCVGLDPEPAKFPLAWPMLFSNQDCGRLL